MLQRLLNVFLLNRYWYNYSAHICSPTGSPLNIVYWSNNDSNWKPESSESLESPPASHRSISSVKQFKLDNEESRSPQPLTPQAFRYQIAGSHVITLMIDDAKVTFVYYDHSLIIESEVLDLQDPEQKLLFVKMIKQMHALSPEALEIIPNLQAPFMYDRKQLKSTGLYLDPAAKEGTIPSNKFLAGCLYTGGEDGECDWNGMKLVMKISRPVKGRVPEHESIQRCIDMAVDEHAWVLKHLPIVLGWFIADGSAVQDRLKIKFGDGY
ncbi:hypothetical protein BT96DRAFT_950818 [Gymnopus androsaceus JB14]|uniref:Fungal-type protein kinase domain-containing protein n=1 Tax=Gymnopus androsaceus JB14 TaxID=1447944 RepID=A0A6A4GF61_9AGAR|nr:hypothetical protein BT96DRAFT_950818 [Gymnopus androsaceus JB14]